MATPPLTPEQIADLRRKLGDTGTPPVFSDTELEALWQTSDGNLTLTIIGGYEDLMGNAWRFTDYTQNASQEKSSQIFENLRKALAYWKAKADEEAAALRNDVVISRLRTSPPRRRDRLGDSCNTVSLDRRRLRRRGWC